MKTRPMIGQEVLTDKISQEMMEQANIPPRFQNAKWEKIKDTDLVEKSKPDITTIGKPLNFGNGLIIEGPLNSGKTALACLIAKETMRLGALVTFIPMYDLMMYQIEKTKTAYNEIIMERVRRSNLVIIDDLGTETFGPNSKGSALVESVIRDCYSHRRSMIIVTNLAVNTLCDHYPAPLVSLIQRVCKPLTVSNTQWQEAVEEAGVVSIADVNEDVDYSSCKS